MSDVERVRRELAQAQAQLAELQHVARIGTWSWDVVEDLVTWSDEMYRIAGIETGTPIRAEHYRAMYHPEDGERVRGVVRGALETGATYRVEYRIVRPDGAVRWMEGRGHGTRDDSGQVTRLFGTAQDITEKKHAELQALELAAATEAREAAEAALRWLRFLAEASTVLSSSLEYETTLRNVAQLAVPAIADWCAVDLALPSGEMHRVAVEHTDASKLELAKRLEQEYPPDLSQPHGVGEVMRSGRPEYMEDIPEELLEAGAHDEHHLELLRQLGLRSYIVVPLLARDRVLGAFTLVQAESGRRFVESDVEYVADLGRRAAVAIDNARLVSNLEAAQHQLEEQSSELELQASELESQTAELEKQTLKQQDLLEALGSERSRLSAIIEHAPIGIVFAEAPSGRILHGNAAAERILRHPVRYSGNVDEYVEWEAFHADGRPLEGSEYPLARALSTGSTVGPDDYLYQRGDGTRAWVRLTAAPVRDGGGEVIAGLVLIDDIDEERRAIHEREALLRQVSEERRLLSEIVENAPAVMALYSGPDHVVRMVNPEWTRTVGKPDAVGRPFRSVFPEWVETGMYELLDRVYQSGEPFTDPELAVPLERWDSGVLEETFWNLVWLPLPQRDDGTRDVLVHAVEITSQVRARRQVHGLTQAGLAVHSAQTLPEALAAITEQARSIIGAHQAITSMSVNQDWAQSVSSVSMSDKYAHWRDYDVPPTGVGIYSLVCESNEPVRLTHEQLEAHPRWRGFSGEGSHPPMRGWLAAPLVARDGSNLGLIQLSDREYGDFTADDEAILVQLAQMASIAIENAQLYERALDASRTKSDFLATMSHELRTPLNAMIGYSELLEMGVPDRISDAARKQVERIRLAAQHLLQLIEEILTFTRVEAGREHVLSEPVSLRVLTDEVRAIIEPLAARKQLAFDVHIPEADIEFVTDPRKVRQVLLNLLGNAIKFTEHGSVTFHAHVDERAMVLEVRDTGIGMSDEDLGRMYEPFWQAETAMHARSGGTGLGLPVSRQLVELLGGSIAVSSASGVGTTFVVRLPLKIAAQADQVLDLE